MWLLITFSCAMTVHECVTQKQTYHDIPATNTAPFRPAKQQCLDEAELKQDTMDLNGVSRFVLICREGKE